MAHRQMGFIKNQADFELIDVRVIVVKVTQRNQRLGTNSFYFHRLMNFGYFLNQLIPNFTAY